MKYNTEFIPTKVVGGFTDQKDIEFKDGMKNMLESLNTTYQIQPLMNIGTYMAQDSLREAYKAALIGDMITTEATAIYNQDPYLATMPAKMEQMFENTAGEMLKEASVGNLTPIVGVTPPVMKKSFLEQHAKDIVPVEVPTKPIINLQFERKFVQDAQGNAHYIPDIFYTDEYADVVKKGRGNELPSTWYPTDADVLPMNDFDVLAIAGGSLAARDSLALDFAVKAVKMQCGDELITITVDAQPDYGSKTINKQVVYTVGGTTYKDNLVGSIDTYTGKISLASTNGLIKKIQFGGHLSNENNNNGLNVERRRETVTFYIEDNLKVNIPYTVETVKDNQALFNLDYTTEMIADMSDFLSQTKDSDVIKKIRDVFAATKNVNTELFGYKDGFTEEEFFSCVPDSNKYQSPAQWVENELKFRLSRFVQRMKDKIKEASLMFVLHGHPDHISLLQDGVKWLIDQDTKVGGVQMEYSFGIFTAIKDRVHVVSTRKIPKSHGIRCIAISTTPDVVTWKNYDYSMNIENGYRDPIRRNVPNIMGTSRYTLEHVLPVQGEMHILNDDFGAKAPGAPSLITATPTVDVAGGALVGTQLVTLSCTTTGATIYYTIDGTTPDFTSASCPTGTTITIASTATLKAVAYMTGYTPSGILTEAYTIS